MSKHEEQELVRKVLEPAGFHVEKIPEAEEKRGDWLVTDEIDEYVVEEKDKDDSQWHKRLVAQAQQEGSAFGTLACLPDERASKVLRKAARQVASTPARASAFKLIWFASHGADAGSVLTSAFCSLYGNATVFPCDRRGEMGEQRICFYWYHGEFHRLHNIDAVILYGQGKSWLCINHFSPRYDEFKKTKLARHFPKLTDPLALEAKGDAYIVDGDVDRKNEAAIQMFLRKKYALDGVGRIAEMQVRSIITFSVRE